MKLNEVKKVDEVNLSHVLGDYGSAAVKQIGNRIMGNAEGQLSVKDKMAKQKFIADFIGRANTNLNSAIKSGSCAIPIWERRRTWWSIFVDGSEERQGKP